MNSSFAKHFWYWGVLRDLFNAIAKHILTLDKSVLFNLLVRQVGNDK